jgi:DNA-binding GntR family transcriptional regulator
MIDFTVSSLPINRPLNDQQERFRVIYETLRDRICVLEYPPGMRLKEEILSKEFGVSRTPIRRVLGYLEAQGFVQPLQGVGTIVTAVEEETLAETYELRKALAVLLGQLSPAEDPGPVLDRLAAIRAAAQGLYESRDIHDFARLNIELFNQIMALTGNETLKSVSRTLYYQACRSWVHSIPEMDLKVEIDAFVKEIDDISHALAAGDIDAAGHIRRAHISMSFERMQNRRKG